MTTNLKCESFLTSASERGVPVLVFLGGSRVAGLPSSMWSPMQRPGVSLQTHHDKSPLLLEHSVLGSPYTATGGVCLHHQVVDHLSVVAEAASLGDGGLHLLEVYLRCGLG